MHTHEISEPEPDTVPDPPCDVDKGSPDWTRARDAERDRRRLSEQYAAEATKLRRLDPTFEAWANKTIARFEADPLLRDYAGAQAYLERMDAAVQAAPENRKQNLQAAALGELVRDRLQEERIREDAERRAILVAIRRRSALDVADFHNKLARALQKPEHRDLDYLRGAFRSETNAERRALLAAATVAPQPADLMQLWHDQLARNEEGANLKEWWDAEMRQQAEAFVAADSTDKIFVKELHAQCARIALLANGPEREVAMQDAAERAAFLGYVDAARAAPNLDEEQP